MPHRMLNMNELVAYLHLPQADVERLVRNREIPFELRKGEPVFSRQQMDAWASQHILNMKTDSLSRYHADAARQLSNDFDRQALMPELLAPGRIHPDFSPRTKPSVLREMVKLAEQTGLLYDSDSLLTSLMEREALCSTAMPGGLALMHPRYHDPYLFETSFIILARAAHPIHAGAIDGQPTDLFFLVCCHDDRIHLHTLARLCTMGHQTDMLAQLRQAPDADAMFDIVVQTEQRLLETITKAQTGKNIS